MMQRFQCDAKRALEIDVVDIRKEKHKIVGVSLEPAYLIRLLIR